MFSIKRISATLIAAAVFTSSAMAADMIAYPTSASPEPIPVYNDPGFDWTGFYAGVYGAAQNYQNTWEYGLGVDVGANVQFEYFLLGGEVAIEGLTSGNTGRVYGQALARGGIVVTDDLLVYAAGGYGGDFSSGDRHWLAGGGVEYAVSDDLSVRGQYLHGFAANAASTDTNQFTVGANFHF